MSKYTVTSLNYIASGDGRDLVNVDYRLKGVYDLTHVLAVEPNLDKANPLSLDILLEQGEGEFLRTEYIQKEKTYGSTLDGGQISVEASPLSREETSVGIVLNEQQRWYDEQDKDMKAYIRLYLSCCTPDEREKLAEFYKSSVHYEHTFEIENGQADGYINELDGRTRLSPIYDMDDLCLKSRNVTKNANTTDFDRTSPSKTEDFYLPAQATAMCFRQVGNTSYILSNPTSSQPDRAYVSLRDQRTDSETHSSYYYKFGGDTVRTYMYAPVSAYGASSYREAFESGAISSNEEFFRPDASFENIDYNYMVEFPMGQITRQTATDYDNGNVYGEMFHTKNSLNSLYSNDVLSAGELRNCRQYVGMGKCGNKLFLKYFDCVGYTQSEKRAASALPY